MKRPFLWLCALLYTSVGLAQTPAYLDDRSTPASVLESLYNAVNRHEYARAYSYWHAGVEALPPYSQFVQGYADTVSVRLTHGRVAGEGAAGSIFYTVPVRLEAHHTDGSTRVFVGCYTLRLVQPGVQAPPFRPLSIIGGELRQPTGEAAPRLSPPPTSLCRSTG